MTDPAVLLGTLRQTLAKDYEVEGYIGGGSLGLIYKALEREGRRPVALRVVPPDGPPGLGERVRREARVAINLVHSNIVPVYKVSQAPGTDYYTMKFVDGVTLERILGNQGTLPVPVVLAVLRSLVRALAFAHSRRVIHRDVRSGNVFVDREGNVSLSDTGIGRALRELGPASAGMRSALFASPELCAGQELVPQADQYAVGALTHLMLTGWPPFTADTPEEVAQLHLTATPPDLSTLRPDTPKQLVEVVRRVLKKTPAERYPTTLEFLAAIQAAPLSDQDRDAALAQLRQWAATVPQPPVQTQAAAPPPPPPPKVAPQPAPRPQVAPPPPAPAPQAPAPRPSAPRPAPQVAAPAPAATAPPAPAASAPPARPSAPTVGAPPQRPVSPPPPPPPPVVPPPLPPPLALEPLVPPPEAPPAREREWREPAAEAPRPSRPSSPPVRPSAERSSARFRGFEEIAPSRRLPIVPIVGGIGVLAVAAVAAFLLLGKGKRGEAPATPTAPPAARESTTAQTPAPAPTADTTKAATPAPATPAAPAARGVGWIRIRGDLPDDVVFWLDGAEVSGRLFSASPGEHDLQVETAEFEPWDTTITVRAGDTLRVRVDLILKQQGPPNPPR